MNTSIGTSRGKPASRNFLRDAEPAVDLHGAGVAPLHLGQKLRRVLLLEQDAAHAAAAKIDGEREPDRAGADNDDLRVQLGIPRPVENPRLSSTERVGWDSSHSQAGSSAQGWQ